MSPRTVLVTGASSGIGRATALRLARSGDNVVLVSRSADALSEVAAECVASGGRAIVAVADVSSAGEVATSFDIGEAEFGSIDAVVHAAAVLAYGRFTDVPPPVFDRVVAVNVLGTANVARELITRSQPPGRTLVVVGSVLGQLTAPYLSGYVASKWAVQALVRTLQIEARRDQRIRIGLVSPGGVDTPIYDHCGTYAGRHGRPPPPVTAPERVADLVLASLDKPRRNVLVGRGTTTATLGFRWVPALFDRLIDTFIGRGAMTREPVADSPGNVFEPAGAHAVHGQWDRAREHVRPIRHQSGQLETDTMRSANHENQ